MKGRKNAYERQQHSKVLTNAAIAVSHSLEFPVSSKKITVENYIP
jgi:hypothetical protein